MWGGCQTRKVGYREDFFFPQSLRRRSCRQMTMLQRPSESFLAQRLELWTDEPLFYAHAGGLSRPPASGFIFDEHRCLLGKGPQVYAAACAALDRWQMFPAWAQVARKELPQQVPGQMVAMVVRIVGLWWVNPCRVLRRCDSEASHGFVYGTLPDHAECGEEMFAVEKHPDETVWYVIRAFSRPRHPLAWLGFPLARWWQLRFVRDSQQRMKGGVA